MKLATGILVLLVGLGLGATVLRDAVPVSGAQNTSAQSGAGQNTTLAQQPIKPLNEAAARLQNESNTVDVVKRFEPGLVYISTFALVNNDDPTARLFGGSGASPQGTEQPQGVGSGFFVNAAGDILTNFHVVRGADRIQIRLLNAKQTYEATVVGRAPEYDLALIRPKNIPKDLIRPIPLADSSKLQAGQKAIAMGAPFGFDFSVTEGIVSAVNRRIPIGLTNNGESAGINQRSIQTDAAINPGNSGGPLLDSSGRVIGINTQIISPAGAASGSGQSAGVGFAIPINTAKTLLPRLSNAKGGVVNAPRIGITAFGASLSEFPTQIRKQYNLPDHGVLVQDVQQGSAAQQAGIRAGGKTVNIGNVSLKIDGDVVVQADGEQVDALEDLKAALIEKQPGDTVKLIVRRNNKQVPLNVKLTQASFSTDQ